MEQPSDCKEERTPGTPSNNSTEDSITISHKQRRTAPCEDLVIGCCEKVRDTGAGSGTWKKGLSMEKNVPAPEQRCAPRFVKRLTGYIYVTCVHAYQQ